MVLEKHISIKSATAGRSRNTFMARICGCSLALTGMLMELIFGIIVVFIGLQYERNLCYGNVIHCTPGVEYKHESA